MNLSRTTRRATRGLTRQREKAGGKENAACPTNQRCVGEKIRNNAADRPMANAKQASLVTPSILANETHPAYPQWQPSTRRAGRSNF